MSIPRFSGDLPLHPLQRGTRLLCLVCSPALQGCDKQKLA
ncbi:MAG: hypothetical protein CSYNP_00570 [Syntrophus sp. SKADARSKE-3]|nr:hypothetical protein [Syntrophus sp. SKADARSKE-3]